MSSELSALGLAVDSRSVVAANDDLTEFAKASDNAGKAADTFNKKAGDASSGAQKLGDQTMKTGGAFERLAQAGGKFKGITGAVSETERALVRVARVAGTLTGMFITGVGIQKFFGTADQWSDMSSRVGAAVKDMSAAPVLMQDMLRLANSSYSALNQTVETYARNVGVLRDLGYSAKQATDYTESLNHMLVITATKGERAANVQNALSKAMAIGKLDAEGLESVMNSGGRVAEALAKQLGTTTTGLRGMASEGKITGKVITEALLTSLEDVRKEAGEMPMTVADGFLKIQNSTTALVGSFDKALGASEAFALKLDSVSKAIETMAMADFAGIFDDTLDTMKEIGFIALALSATRLPALLMSIRGVAVATSFMQVQFIAGAVAMRTVGIAAGAATAGLGLLRAALALVGGPIGVLVGATALLALKLYDTRKRVEELAATYSATAVAQDELNAATERFYQNSSTEALSALQTTMAAYLEQLKDQKREIEDELSRATTKNNILWLGIGESDRMVEAQAALDAINEKLFEAESRMSAVDHATSNFAATLARAGETALAENAQASRAAQEMLVSLERRTQLATLEATYGRDSLTLMLGKLAAERDTAAAKRLTMNLTAEGARRLEEAYDATMRAENMTVIWSKSMKVLRDKADEAYIALQNIATTEPGEGWLDTAISKAAKLAATLWDAADAAISASGRSELAPRTSPRPNRPGVDSLGDFENARNSTTGGGAGDERASKMEGLVAELQTEREMLVAWYAEKTDLIQTATDAELEVLGGRQLAIERLEAEHQQRLRGLRDQERAHEQSAQTQMFTTLAGLLSSFGQKSKVAQLAALAINTGIRIRETLQNAAAASVRALAELGPIAGPPAAAKIMAYGKMQAALIAAQGIASAGGGGGGGNASPNTKSTQDNQPQSGPSQAPLRASLDAIDPAAIYSGAAMIKMFEALQKEAGNRGIIWTNSEGSTV